MNTNWQDDGQDRRTPHSEATMFWVILVLVAAAKALVQYFAPDADLNLTPTRIIETVGHHAVKAAHWLWSCREIADLSAFIFVVVMGIVRLRRRGSGPPDQGPPPKATGPT
jgi:hypothetical protein